MIRRAALLALGLAAAVCPAQVYKWVDEKGVTHYSESPPPDRKATKVDTGPSAPPAVGTSDWKQKELESRRRALETKQAQDAAHQRQSNESEVRRARCLRAQRDRDLLESQRPIYQVNERGEKVYLEDAARPAAIEAARRAVDTYCGK